MRRLRSALWFLAECVLIAICYVVIWFGELFLNWKWKDADE